MWGALDVKANCTKRTFYSFRFSDSTQQSCRHVDLHNEGWEKCTQALDAAVQDDKAGPLFEQAAARFAVRLTEPTFLSNSQMDAQLLRTPQTPDVL